MKGTTSKTLDVRGALLAVALGLAAVAPGASAAEAEGTTEPASGAASAPGVQAFGAPALSAQALDERRGGTHAHNDMQLDGVVGSNSASNLTTGANSISTGSFAGASGLPVVIQNSGNNVLIQNATIVNVQIK